MNPTAKRVTAAIAAVTVAGGLVLLGRAQARDPAAAAAAADAAAALERAGHSADAVAGLEAEVAALRRKVRAARKDQAATAAALDRAGARLTESVDDLRAAVEAASADAAGAVDEVAEIVRDLKVLDNRYEYHLGRYHGGG